MKRSLPWILLGLFGLYVAAGLRAPETDSFGAAFGSLPVLHNGRIKPLDSIARTSLLTIRGKQTLRRGKARMGASEWLLELQADPKLADTRDAVRIDDPDILGLFGIRSEKGRYFSIDKLVPGLAEFENQAQRARRVDPKQRTRFEAATVDLHARLLLYQHLKGSMGLSSSESAYLPIPPGPGEPDEAWSSFNAGLIAGMRGGSAKTGVREYADMLEAYRRGDSASFQASFGSLTSALRARVPEAARKADRERRFNAFAPFKRGMVLYVAVFLLGCFSWLGWKEPLRKSAWVLLVLAFAVHTSGLLYRMILEGRPPVTNLYSSAVFVGWGGVLIGVVLERLFRLGIAGTVSSAVGFATLVIAHHLSIGGDTLEMMQAVLDSNFWLATHVITITIGYSSVFLAGTLAHAWIFGKLSGRMDARPAKALVQMTYGVLCFALLMSFVGTVLGGIWADQSWGRFWGWDPKENGALLIVLWISVILHARWGGVIRERGIMVSAVFGNVVTACSWFGVNMLGIGLHSYGFMDKAAFWLAAFCLSQLAVMGIAFLPRLNGGSPLTPIPRA